MSTLKDDPEWVNSTEGKVLTFLDGLIYEPDGKTFKKDAGKTVEEVNKATDMWLDVRASCLNI